MMEIRIVIELAFLVLGIACYIEIRLLREILRTRTGPVWQAATIPVPKSPIGDRIRESTKRPMIYPKTDKQLLEREQRLEKDAGDRGFE
jgi:hypothetical protein